MRGRRLRAVLGLMCAEDVLALGIRHHPWDAGMVRLGAWPAR